MKATRETIQQPIIAYNLMELTPNEIIAIHTALMTCSFAKLQAMGLDPFIVNKLTREIERVTVDIIQT